MSTTVYAARARLPGDLLLARCCVSGGTLEDYFRLLMRESGGSLCLELRPEYHRIPLPCPGGTGTELTPSQLEECYRDQPCHFSPALGTMYFTAIQDGGAFAVLYDSLETLQRKLDLARSMGIPAVLVEDAGLRGQLDREKHPTKSWGAQNAESRENQ